MFLVSLTDLTNMLMDNEAVYKNMPFPESALKKKHLSMLCYICREAVAASTVRIAGEGT